jgi:hypothetical protein
MLYIQVNSHFKIYTPGKQKLDTIFPGLPPHGVQKAEKSGKRNRKSGNFPQKAEEVATLDISTDLTL